MIDDQHSATSTGYDSNHGSILTDILKQLSSLRVDILELHESNKEAVKSQDVNQTENDVNFQQLYTLMEAEVIAMRKNNDKLQVKVEDVCADKDALLTEVTTLCNSNDKLQVEVQILSADKDALQTYVKVFGADKKALQARMERVCVENAILQTKVETVGVEKDELQKKNEVLNEEKNALQAKIHIFGAEVDKVEKLLLAKMQALDMDKDALQTQVHTLCAEKDALQRKMQGLGSVKYMETKVRRLVKDKHEFLAKIKSLDAENATLQTKVETVCADKDAIQTRVQALDADMETLQAEVIALRKSNDVLQARPQIPGADKDALQSKLQSTCSNIPDNGNSGVTTATTTVTQGTPSTRIYSSKAPPSGVTNAAVRLPANCVFTKHEISSRLKVEEDAMHQTIRGRAVLLAQQVHSLEKESTDIRSIAFDNIVYVAEKFLLCQTDFEASGVSSNVTIAYHYTHEQNMDKICQDGLLTLAERMSKNYTSGNSCYFGDGVYTASNPYAYSKRANIGLIVAVLHGRTEQIVRGQKPSTNVNTAIGNKVAKDHSKHQHYNEFVLQESRQCLPLMRFPASWMNPELPNMFGISTINFCHGKLQLILDKLMNYGNCTELETVQYQKGYSYLLPKPNSNTAHAAVNLYHIAEVVNKKPPPIQFTQPPKKQPPAQFVQPLVSPTSVAAETVSYVAPDNLNFDATVYEPCQNLPEVKECAVCLSDLVTTDTLTKGKVVKLLRCDHTYHEQCISASLETSSRCPVCRTHVQEPQGFSPSGTMQVSTIATLCAGSTTEDCDGTIKIVYTLLDGTQKSYHNKPGLQYRGTTRIAYLPNNCEGRKLLQRLKYAFLHGLVFTIGTSLTTGVNDVITWASIHHKTSMTAGVHGYPDPEYFCNCNTELDSLGVPQCK